MKAIQAGMENKFNAMMRLILKHFELVVDSFMPS
jgi:hypothetical protein